LGHVSAADCCGQGKRTVVHPKGIRTLRDYVDFLMKEICSHMCRVRELCTIIQAWPQGQISMEASEVHLVNLWRMFCLGQLLRTVSQISAKHIQERQESTRMQRSQQSKHRVDSHGGQEGQGFLKVFTTLTWILHVYHISRELWVS
jgi:hypothetical protein